MTTEPLPSGQQAAPTVPFRAVLTPHRSLSPTGFVILMSIVGAVSFVAGLAFLLIGAWPVMGFFGLDVALVYMAFRLNFRSGRRLEVIEIDGARLTLCRFDEKGRQESFELNPYWATVRLRRAADGSTSLALASHGRELAFGGFLTDEQRAEFADLLNGALLAARSRPGT